MTFIAYVYGLRFRMQGHVHDGRIRYVGKTVNPKRRFARHMKAKETKGRLYRSVKKNGAAAFSMEIIKECRADSLCEADALALQEEIRTIAEFNTAFGEHGLNCTAGGEGVVLVGEARERHRQASRVALAATKKHPEYKEKLSAAMKRIYETPGYRDEHRERMRKRNLDPTYISNLSKAVERLRLDPVQKERRRVALAEVRSDPSFGKKVSAGVLEFRRENPLIAARMQRRMTETQRQPARREANAKLARELYNDPAFVAKRRAGLDRKHSDPVYANKHAAQTRQRHQDNPLYGLGIKLGIALHWARKHASSGRAEQALKQRRELLRLMAVGAGIPGFSDTEIRRRAALFLEEEIAA